MVYFRRDCSVRARFTNSGRQYIAAAFVFASASFADAARAQQLDNYVPSELPGYDVMPGVTVTSRFRPDYQPLGIRLGSVLVHPEFSQSLGYDQNVLGSANARSSPLTQTQAAIQANTDWSRNSLVLNLNVDRFGYPDLPSQSFTNWSAGIGWTYNIGRDDLSVGISHYNLNQLPNGIDSIGLTQPLSYQTDEARLSYKATRGPWTFVPVADFAATRFNTSEAEAGISQVTSDINRDVETGSLNTFYEFAPQRSALFVIRATTAQYLSGQPRRDYYDVSALMGLDYGPIGVIRFRALLGFETRQYESRQLRNHASPIIEGKAIWTPSGLTTVTATVLRRIEDANEAVQTGYTFTEARLAVDHEYRRNILLQARAWAENAEYLGVSSHQTLFGGGASVTYLLNRNLRLVGTYDYSHSDTDALLKNKYNRSIFLLQLRVAI